MKNRNVLAIFIGVGLILTLAFQVTAKQPIEGWDKAKFGMTPQELRNVYKGEERHFEDFWKEAEEGFYVEKSKYGLTTGARPYTLSTSKLKVFGENPEIAFSFVDNRLFKIQISGSLEEGMSWSWDMDEEEIKLREKRANSFMNQLFLLEKFFVEKYGQPYFRLIGPSGMNIFISVWKDAKGNTFMWEVILRPYVVFQKGTSYLYPDYVIAYVDKELCEMWHLKVGEELKKRIKEKREFSGTEMERF